MRLPLELEHYLPILSTLFISTGYETPVNKPECLLSLVPYIGYKNTAREIRSNPYKAKLPFGQTLVLCSDKNKQNKPISNKH